MNNNPSFQHNISCSSCMKFFCRKNELGVWFSSPNVSIPCRIFPITSLKQTHACSPLPFPYLFSFITKFINEIKFKKIITPFMEQERIEFDIYSNIPPSSALNLKKKKKRENKT